jgi:hypothetical protein
LNVCRTSMPEVRENQVEFRTEAKPFSIILCREEPPFLELNSLGTKFDLPAKS